MARSSYIYLIKHRHEDTTLGCFTVKHEAITFWERVLMSNKDHYLLRYVDKPVGIESPTRIELDQAK